MAWLADGLWRGIEATYGWCFRLRVVGDPETSILRLGIRHHWGRALTLPDGARVRRGDRIAELHFRNEVMRDLQASAPGPVRALAALRARGLQGLMCLARALETDPALKDVQALFGETILWPTIRRLGFWPAPLRGPARRRLVSAFQRLLMRHYSPAGWERLRRLGTTESRALWISRAHLLRLYGPGSDPQRRRHPTPRRAAVPAIPEIRPAA